MRPADLTEMRVAPTLVARVPGIEKEEEGFSPRGGQASVTEPARVGGEVRDTSLEILVDSLDQSSKLKVKVKIRLRLRLR